MTDDAGRRTRDNDLALAHADHTRRLKHDYEDWIQREGKALSVAIQMLEVVVTDAPTLDRLGNLRFRLLEIMDNDVVMASASVDGKLDEIDAGVFEDALDAHDHLSDGLCRFESLVRQLLRIRREHDEIWADHSA